MVFRPSHLQGVSVFPFLVTVASRERFGGDLVQVARLAQRPEGLGLATCARLPTVHNGLATVSSKGKTPPSFDPEPLVFGFDLSKRSAQGLGIVTRQGRDKTSSRFDSVSVASRARHGVRPIQISFFLTRAITKLINQSNRGQ